MKKLNIGCGEVHFDGWVNIDINPGKADLVYDVRNPMPYSNNSVDFIYNEHFIEHLDVRDGLKFLQECYRVLRPGGMLRIATPDLDYIIFRYFFFWRKQGWIKKYGYDWVKTRAELMNINFREWGHQYLYNKEELGRRLREAGFEKIKKAAWGKSKWPELTKLETRKESRLILEAVK